MRKVLSFVLVLSLVLGSFSMAFAAPLSDVAGEDFEDAVNVLTELGVVSGYPDGTYKPDNIVTRAEMAVIVVRALGLADYATGVSSFSDMAGHWSNPYVAYATSLGVIAGYPDGTFRPDATVTYDEAATMLVAALGYTPESLQGTWPANYVVKAKSLGILDGIKAGPAGATRGDIAIMAFQTLNAKIGSTDKDGKWDANDPVDNMLKRLGAKEYNADAKGEAQPFLVTKGIADDAIANLMPYIGAWITAYENSDGDIIAVKEVKSTFLKGKFDGEGTFKADGVEYSVSKDAKADLGLGGATASAIAFVNGDVEDEFFDLDTDDGKYTMAVDLSGKTIKEVYSVLEWNVNEHDLFSDGDADEISEDQKLLGVKFPLNDDEEIDLSAFELRGVDSLDDIKKDNVVYVYKNKENEIVRVEVGTEVVTGEITRKTSDGKYTVGGKTYEKADLVDLNFGFDARAGDEVEFYLDYYGNIYRCDEVKGKADTYAVVLETDNGEPGKLGKAGKLYLFLADGSDEVFEVDDKKVTPEALTVGTIIKYSVDKNGVINDVKNVSNTTQVSGEAITAKGYFKGLAINTNAVIFTFNGADDKADPDNYSVTTLSKILDSENVTAYAYDVDKNKVAALLINSDVTGSDAVYGVVTDQADNNSDLEYEVTMLIDGKSGTYDTDKADYNYDELYKVTFSPAGEAKLAAADPNATASAVVTTAGGFELSGNVVKCTTTAGMGTVVNIKVNDVLTLDSDAVVYVENSKGKFEVGSLRDIIRKENVKIEFYDVYDEDTVYDIVLIKRLS